MVKIYESPDGGKTVYERDTVTGERVCVEEPSYPDWHVDADEWWGIQDLAEQGNKTLQNLLKELKLVYNLSKEEEN